MVFRLQGWRVVRQVLLVLAVILTVAAAAVAALFVGLDVAYAGQVFKGVYVQGINIGGLTREGAIEKLRSELDLGALNRDLTLAFDGYSWPLPLYEIDAYVDLDATVDRALKASREMPFYERWAHRAVFRGLDRSVDLAIHVDWRKLENFLSTLESTINRPPVNAEIKLEGRKLVFQKSQDGWELDADEAREAIVAALSSTERVAELRIEVTPPEVSDSQVGKVITVDKTNHLLTLYNNMEVEKQYPVAVGMPSWPTPSGTYKVVGKEKNPTWVNPGTSWAATMPPYIPPGPGNPLGTRAIQTSAPGVFIHGTYNSWSIGTNASHGCIRMYIKDSEDLYERVPVGIPVLIF
ncbi:MAG: L,D-transpeptidase/peptidoglycan binding protein [Actinobacteria bacterium]|nr:L,D-transpeptidase/peptidoglycan binding protein [Actinomycetota bacterium]